MRRRDQRTVTLLAMAAAVAIAALTVQHIPTGGWSGLEHVYHGRHDTTVSSVDTSAVGLGSRFERGVRLLRAGHHERAVEQFHAALHLVPTLPEAHVNLGFALLALGRTSEARDAFRTALDIRPMQANAYWGLAVSLEENCDLAGAIGAMRTYVHLADPASPFLRRANAALWEWENDTRCKGDAALVQE